MGGCPKIAELGAESEAESWYIGKGTSIASFTRQGGPEEKPSIVCSAAVKKFILSRSTWDFFESH